MPNIFKINKEDKKLKYIEKNLKDLSKLSKVISTITSLKDDNDKIKFLDYIVGDNSRFLIIASFKDDDTKAKYLNKLVDEKYKAMIISSFNSIDKIVLNLDRMNEDYYKTEIIMYLPDDNIKIKCLDKLNVDYYKSKVISTIKSEGLKESSLDALGTDTYKIDIISSFHDVLRKKHSLDKLTSDSSKAEIIQGFTSDSLKESCLDKLSSDKEKSIVITSIKSSVRRKNAIDKLTTDDAKVILINTMFTKDSDKVSLLDKISNDYSKGDLILSLKDDSLKEMCLNKLTNDTAKIEVIVNLSSDDTKEKYLTKTFGTLKLYLINSIKDEKRKAKLLSLYKDESNKAELITTMSTEEKMSYLNKLSTDKEKLLIINSISTKEAKLLWISRLTDYTYVIKILNSITPNIKEKYQIISTIINSECRINTFLEFTQAYALVNSPLSFTPLSLLDDLSQKYNIPIDNLNKFVDNFGLKSISLLFKNNIPDKTLLSIINDSEKLNNLLILFNKNNAILDKNQIDIILESILTKEFIYTKKDIWLMFSTMKNMITVGDESSLHRELLNILEYSKNSLSIKGSNLLKFIQDCDSDKQYLSNFIKELLQVDNNKTALDKLKTITSQYINLEIEDYKSIRKKEAYRKELSISKKIDRNYLIKYLTESYDYSSLLNLLSLYSKEVLQENYLSEKNNFTIKEVLFWKINNPNNAPKEIKKYFKELNNIFIDLYNNHYNELALMVYNKMNSIHECMKIKYDDKYIWIDNSLTLVDILSNTDYQKLDNILAPENFEKVNKIVSLINKYHVLGFGNNFDSLLNKIDFSDYNLIMSTGISNLLDAAISFNTLEKNKLSSPNLLDILTIFNMYSKGKLSILLGRENADLFLLDPAPNATPLTKEERIKKIPPYINLMYHRQEITIPEVSISVKTNNNKVINASFASFTDPINLTYGERTGACMRIGGSAEPLLKFCISNPSGFHIKFTDEEDNFISRVSGFRVGNTIFLNELKCSVLDGYSDEDVVLACKTISKKIIDLSLNSTFPIDNVVISNRFALSSSTPDTCLSISLAKDGYESPRYCDVNPNSCLLLTSSSKDPKVPFVPFKKNSSPLPVYQTKRITIKYTTDPKEINESIIRLNIINEILSGVPLDDVSLNVPNNEYLCAYIGEDFYVAIDQNSNPITYIMPMSNDKKRATTELNSSLKNLSHILKSESINNSISPELEENTKKIK